MSGHGHHDAGDDALGHDDHEHETSSDDFPADEPRSPGWLPLLGGAFLLATIFVFVAVNAGGKTAEELAKEAAAASPSASAAAPATAAAAANPAPAQRPSPAMPVGAQLPANHPQVPGGGTR